MNTPRIESELLELERQYWQAMQDRDVSAAVQLTDFPCIIAGPSGIGRIEQSAFEQMMKDPPYKIRKVELSRDAKVRLIREDVAVVAYKVHEELTVDGEAVTIDAADSSTWIRRNGHWRCALHTEALAGDSYGRDRASTS